MKLLLLILGTIISQMTVLIPFAIVANFLWICRASASIAMPCGSVAECLKTRMYTVPGPNPIVAPAASGWSSTECEMAGGVFEISKNEYVLVYHCLNNTGSYNVGMSTSCNRM